MGPAEALPVLNGIFDGIAVEVVCSPAPGQVDVAALTVALGSTVADAVRASGVQQRHPACAGADHCVGVWGRLCPATQVLRAGDRVELYRPLTVDPKEARRRRQQGQADRPAARAGRTRRAAVR